MPRAISSTSLIKLRDDPHPYRRFTQLVVGLVLCGWGIALMVEANLGLSPWDVLHEGASNHTGLSIGIVNIAVGLILLAIWIPLGEPAGIGTVTNAFLIGLVTDLTLWVLPTPEHMATRIAYLVLGAFLFGPGSGLYIGAGLGPGPRDGLMTALARRGPSLRLVRTLIELSALLIGIALGGTVGFGTILFAVTVGPNVQLFLEWTIRRQATRDQTARLPKPDPIAHRRNYNS